MRLNDSRRRAGLSRLAGSDRRSDQAAGLDAFGADPNPADQPVDQGPDRLEVRQEPAGVLPSNMTATPFFFSRFAFVDIHPARHGAFTAVEAALRHNGL